MDECVPVLGICLGFQSLVTHYGGRIRRLHRGLHGMVRDISHRGVSSTLASTPSCVGEDIFSGVGSFKATLYHSLCADIGQDEIEAAEWDLARWRPAPQCPEVEPLAWTEEVREDGVERILMAARHRNRPFWGLQYHPESVCTESEGNRVILNWFSEALKWNASHGRAVLLRVESDALARRATRPSLLSCPRALGGQEKSTPAEGGRWETVHVNHELRYQTLNLPDSICVPDIVEALASEDREHIVLDSANSHLPTPTDAMSDVRGRYSIIGLDLSHSLRLKYHTGDAHAVAAFLPETAAQTVEEKISLDAYGGIWNLLADFQHRRRIDPPADIVSPFLGGFMGYVTYEQGVNDIGVSLTGDRGHRRPDIYLPWVTKSIVVDHRKGLLHVQQLRPRGARQDYNWIERIVSKLQGSQLWGTSVSRGDMRTPGGGKKHHNCGPAIGAKVSTPAAADYKEKVRTCQEFIAAGDSYELCLTDQATVIRPRSEPDLDRSNGCKEALKHSRLESIQTSGSWRMFKTLRKAQPAPYASYVRLGGATLVSASPERFLQYDREGLCSMRPMKGTVRKSSAVATLEEAEKILHIPKEEAENLMIVDLVRHDLHGICGPGNVSVPRLLKVEEYESVFQMVTVVEGKLPWREGGRAYTGLDVLAASLPPGSMTGAPKKRSCEILQQIEGGQERSLYSGVVGYMCASGRGDWSVTIRSMFRWDDEQPAKKGAEEEPGEVWRVGAGGAVTILSTPEGETEEMFLKLAGTLGCLGG